MTDGYYIYPDYDGKALDKRIVTPELHTLEECESYAKEHGLKYKEWVR